MGDKTSIFYGKTFFPGTRKEIRIESVQLHSDKSDVQKIKLVLSMPLDDGKQVGMPSWIHDDYARLATVGCEAGSVKYPDMALKEMTLDCFEDFGADNHSKRLLSPNMNSFSMQRGDKIDKESPTPVWLEFTAYVDFSTSIWAWLPQVFRPGSVWMRFECTQQEIPAAASSQLSLQPATVQ